MPAAISLNGKGDAEAPSAACAARGQRARRHHRRDGADPEEAAQEVAPVEAGRDDVAEGGVGAGVGADILAVLGGLRAGAERSGRGGIWHGRISLQRTSFAYRAAMAER